MRVGVTYKYRMIRRCQIDGLMASKWQGRLVSVPVCVQTMQRQNETKKKIECVFAHKPRFYVCAAVVLCTGRPTFDTELPVLHTQTAMKQGTRLLLWCYCREQQGVTEKPPSHSHAAYQSFHRPTQCFQQAHDHQSSN